MKENTQKLEMIAIETLIKDPNHPRQKSGDLRSLSTSIRHDGLMTPISVAKVGDDKYHVIDGWRRIEALKGMGMTKVSCFVYEDLKEADSAHKSFILNTERNQLNEIEIALHIKKMRDDFGYSFRDLEIMGYSSSANISKQVKLLDLPKDVQKYIVSGSLTKAHGTELLKLGDQGKMSRMAKRALDHEWSANNVKTAIQRHLAPKATGKSTGKKILPAQDIPGVYFKDSKDMSEFPDESVGCIFTSPPYFVGMEYEKGFSFDEHLENIKEVMAECARVTVPGGVIALNVDDIHNFKGNRGNDKSAHIQLMIHKYQAFLKKHGVSLEDRIVWVKDQNPHSQDMSKAFSSDTVHTTYRHIKRHDFVYIFRKKGERVVPSEEASLASGLTKEEWRAYIPSVWTIPMVWKSEGHPNVFPEELARRVIKMYSFAGEKVLDPFLGSGTTIKVARELDREGVGYERAEELYRDVIAAKLEGTFPGEEAEPTESVSEFVKRQMNELEANQPAKPEAEAAEDEKDYSVPVFGYESAEKELEPA